MSTLADSLRASTTLEDHEIEWVHLVVGDWQDLAGAHGASILAIASRGIATQEGRLRVS